MLDLCFSLTTAGAAIAQEVPAGMSVPLSERVVFEPGPYQRTADSKPQPGIPRGTITQHLWSNSKIYPGTIREYWVYVPAQYDPDAEDPASLMVFQDGHAYVGDDSSYRATTVMDNLIAAGVEGHNPKHGTAVFPDAMRWLWRDWGKAITSVSNGLEGDRHFHLTESDHKGRRGTEAQRSDEKLFNPSSVSPCLRALCDSWACAQNRLE